MSALGAFFVRKSPFIGRIMHNRQFWHWLNIMFNNVDKERIKEVGADLACAEWLLRNGASVKWLGQNIEINDYNQLIKKPRGSRIEEVHAIEASIMDCGFDHFIGCDCINKMVLHNCKLIDDKAIEKLNILSKSLSDLQITSCRNITDSGLLCLIEMKNLKSLKLGDLPYVRDKEKTIGIIKSQLSNCEIKEQI